MKSPILDPAEIESHIAEFRAMADMPAAAAPTALARAKELRFNLQAQTTIAARGHEYADAVYRDLEVLLHDTRWKAELSLDYLKRIKTSCARLSHYANLHRARLPNDR